jgi:hypothetical protein
VALLPCEALTNGHDWRKNKMLGRHLGDAKPYTDEQWDGIKRHLFKAGVPEAMLSDRLRYKLDGLASTFARRSQSKYRPNARKPPSLKEQATELRKQIADLQTTIRILNDYATYYFFGPEFFDVVQDESEVSRRRAPKNPHRAQWPLIRCKKQIANPA